MIRRNMTSYGKRGNCLSATIASLLHLEVETVPLFLPDEQGLYGGHKSQILMVNEWLKSRGLYLLEVKWDERGIIGEGTLPPDARFLGVVKSTLGEGFTHSVVCKCREENGMINIEIAHDPDDRDYGERKYELIMLGFLVPLYRR